MSRDEHVGATLAAKELYDQLQGDLIRLANQVETLAGLAGTYVEVAERLTDQLVAAVGENSTTNEIAETARKFGFGLAGDDSRIKDAASALKKAMDDAREGADHAGLTATALEEYAGLL